jgi:energy-coupling factor transporter ATP-binding protein EcfA2
MPYGLNKLEQVRKAGWGLIVEGESDCWTCWFHNIPALGAPGKGIWPTAWGDYLKGLEVYVWQEPEAEDFVLRVLKSAPDLRYIRAPDGIKDISEAHIQGLTIPAWLEGLKTQAGLGQALKARYDNERLAQLYKEAEAVIQVEDPLELVKDAIRGLGYGGDLKPALIAYLAATSRLLAMREGSMPVHLLLTGPSSSGKSYTVNLIKKLLPEAAHHTVDAGSPRTVIYNDADLQHRLLVFGEADSLPGGEDNPAASAIRNLLQDHSLHYEVTIRDPDTGDFTVRKVEKPGPTVLITTSTRSLGAQLMTRLFSLETGDSKEQIGAALETQAALETKGAQPLDGALVAFQHYLQLRAPLNVIVPFAGELARAMSKTASAPRILRDFARLLSLIKSTAVIRLHWRQTDGQGRIVATLEDYETVRELVNDMYVHSSTGATGDVRALVEAVKALDAARGGSERITNTTLTRPLGIGVMQVTRRAQRAIKQGWLVNREQRKSYPADYAPGEPMPEAEGLPALTRVDRVDSERVLDFSFKNEGVDTLTALTNGNTPHPPGIPCVKGAGGCSLRTDATETFSCPFSPQECRFFRGSE